MDNYTITKKQIAILSNTSIEAFHYLNEEFPDAFKTELELNKWYKSKNQNKKTLFYLTSLPFDENSGYGVNYLGIWSDKFDLRCSDPYGFELATPEEVEAALINEAKKRGFKEGAKYLSPLNKYGRAFDGEMYFNHNNLYENGKSIFNNGIWAEIIPQEKTVVPMEKALKIIAKKMKVSPENIEIKS